MKKNLLIALSLFFLSCKNTDLNLSKTLISINIYSTLPENIWILNDYKSLCKTDSDNLKIIRNIINPDIIENKHTKGREIIELAKACNFNMVTFSAEDLEYLKIPAVRKYIKIFPDIILTNVYSKFDNDLPVKKYYLNSNYLITSVIINPLEPESPFYISDYRIENPLYEINKIFNRFKNRKIKKIVILNIKNDMIAEKIFEEKLTEFIEKLEHAPDIILTDVKDIKKIKNTLIIPSGSKNVNFKIKKIMEFYSKYELKELKPEKTLLNSDEKFKEIDKITEKVKNHFNSELTHISEDLNLSDYNTFSLFVAHIISKYMYSDFLIFDKYEIKNTVKPGKITLKEVYNLLKDNYENIIYAKIKGENIPNFISDTILRDELATANIKIFLKDGEIKNIVIRGKTLQPQKIYSVIIPINYIRKNQKVIGYINEFSTLNVKMIDTLLWYFKTHRRLNRLSLEPAVVKL